MAVRVPDLNCAYRTVAFELDSDKDVVASHRSVCKVSVNGVTLGVLTAEVPESGTRPLPDQGMP